ncbi:MAG: ABC transporter substrate-binding protein [Lachnospiraceae bacterium]|nr:ABC transporter substrate-binding protein [Lachnospiraceae bacterium]
MKKRILAAAAMLLCLPLGACEGKNQPARELTVFNLCEYMDPKAIEMFTLETGITIKYEEALTAEDMYTKYKAGGIDYDLLCTCDYMVRRLIAEGEVQPVDFSSFEYGKNIGQRYWDYATAYDPGNKYSLPYFWGTVGILYDTTKVHGPIDSWDVLFNGEYSGEIIMQNSMMDTYIVALKYLGYSLNTTDEAEIRAAQDLLVAQKPDVSAYLVDEARDEVVAGNATMAVVYSGEAYLGREYNPNLDYVIPKEGTELWIDSWLVTKNCKDPDAAKQFLDFLCREDVAQMNFEYIYYSTPNEAVLNGLSDEERADEALAPDPDSCQNSEICLQSDAATTELLNELWKELRGN